jgi:hypothetical protein
MLAEAQPPAAVAPTASLQQLHFEIERLNSEYAHVLDSERYEEYPELFVEDCLYRVVPRENHLLGLPIAVIHCESKNMIKDRVYAARESTMVEPRTRRRRDPRRSQRTDRADHDQPHDGDRAVGLLSGPHRAQRRPLPIQGTAAHTAPCYCLPP